MFLSDCKQQMIISYLKWDYFNELTFAVQHSYQRCFAMFLKLHFLFSRCIQKVIQLNDSVLDGLTKRIK